MVRDQPSLSLSPRCRLLSIGRSSLHYKPKGESAETLALMRQIDQPYLKHPFYGARQMVRHLRREKGTYRTAPGLWAFYRAFNYPISLICRGDVA